MGGTCTFTSSLCHFPFFPPLHLQSLRRILKGKSREGKNSFFLHTIYLLLYHLYHLSLAAPFLYAILSLIPLFSCYTIYTIYLLLQHLYHLSLIPLFSCYAIYTIYLLLYHHFSLIIPSVYIEELQFFIHSPCEFPSLRLLCHLFLNS